MEQLYELSFGKRPFEELYDLRSDPHQMHNVAADPDYAEARKRPAERLTRALRRRGDPRATGRDVALDRPPHYYGGTPTWPGQSTIEQYRREE